jgi:hypothetical protein
MELDPEKEIKITVNHVPYKLSESDYQSIWSQLWLKIFIWCSVVVGLVCALFGFGVYTFAKERVAISIESYMKGDEFKKHMNAQFDDKVKNANTKLKQIDEGLNKLAIYEAAPYKISGNTLTTVDAKGNYITIEHGVADSSKNISFSFKFKEPPTVVVTPLGNGLGTRDHYFSVPEVTTDHFRARYHGEMLTRKFSWIAIGK